MFLLQSIMKIQLISDTHDYLNRFIPHQQADLIIHAGDFTCQKDEQSTQIHRFVAMCQAANKPYVLVLGNHDYYGRSIGTAYPKALQKQGINVLYRGREFVFGGMTFVGDTLWTDFDLYGKPSSQELVLYRRSLMDFYDIDGLSCQEIIDEHQKACRFLENYRHKKDVFVITHFPPCEVMVHDDFQDSDLNPYFVNNMDVSGFTHWACGHTHFTDRRTDKGCQLYINASGYQSAVAQECHDFDPSYLIEI